MLAGQAERTALSILVLFVCFCSSLHAQVPQNITARQINLPYYEGTELRGFFSGKDAVPITGGKGELLITDFEMKWFRGGRDALELIIRAPESFFKFGQQPPEKRATAWSEKQIKVYSGTTNYFIEGEGFFCEQDKTNALLTISNQVHTVLERGSTNAQPRPPLEIFSQRFDFTAENNVQITNRTAIYTGRVRVEDPELGMTCSRLTVDFPVIGTNKVRNILAEQDVVIIGKLNGSRATGQRAMYGSDEEHELLTLVGHPTWRDAQTECVAEKLVFDRRNQSVLADHNAVLKVPRKSVAAVNLPGAQANRAASTNEVIQIAADCLHVLLPSTNRPFRYLHAQTNVVITSESDNSQAGADDASFDEETGMMRLNGRASWRNEQFHARGDSLWLDKTNGVFGANKNAYLRLLSRGRSGAPATNQWVEVLCERYEITTNKAVFYKAATASDKVRANFVQGQSVGQFDCDHLELFFVSNQVDTVVAQGNVVFDEKSNAANGTTCVQKSIKGGRITVRRSVRTGLTESILTETNAVLTETDRRGEREKVTKLTGNRIAMKFMETTNQLQSLVAEGDVTVVRDANRAMGQKAVYGSDGGVERFEITGKPTAVAHDASRGDVLISDADILVWDHKTGRVSGKGPFRITPLAPNAGSKSTGPSLESK